MFWNIWVLILIPVAWFLQNCIHEGSHILFGWLDEGIKPLGFYPYPHIHDGQFYFARYTYIAFPIPDEPHLIRHIAPIITNVGMLLFGAFTLFLTKSIWILPFMVCALMDALWWIYGYIWGSEKKDGKRWRNGG